jgi:uncharacterized membrane protein HdeD (DUF308 family)
VQPTVHETRIDLSKKWYLALLRGIMALAVGLLAILLPPSAALTLVAAYLFVDGAFGIGFGLAIRTSPLIRFAFVLEGVVGIVASIFVVTHAAGHSYFIFTLAVWALASGLLEITGATILPKSAWLVAVLGAVSIAFGVVLFFFPEIAAYSFLYLLAGYVGVVAVLFGFFALDLRRELSDQS